MKPRMLDLFCGAGGAGMGYRRAGFDVVGVDINPQPNYPFKFYQADATALVQDINYGCWHEDSNKTALPGRLGVCLGRFDAVHASPPCQASSALTRGTNKGRQHPQLIPAVRAMLEQLSIPTVIENVQGSDLRRDLTLCGEMFGLNVIRHRYFEVSGFDVVQPAHVKHRGRVAGMRHGEWFTGPYFAVYGDGGGKGSVADWQTAMGIGWTDVRKEIAQAIPPAYSEFVGRQLFSRLLERAS